MYNLPLNEEKNKPLLSWPVCSKEMTKRCFYPPCHMSYMVKASLQTTATATKMIQHFLRDRQHRMKKVLDQFLIIDPVWHLNHSIKSVQAVIIPSPLFLLHSENDRRRLLIICKEYSSLSSSSSFYVAKTSTKQKDWKKTSIRCFCCCCFHKCCCRSCRCCCQRLQDSGA